MSEAIPVQSAETSSADLSQTAAPAFARLIEVMGPIRDSGTRIAEFLGDTAVDAAVEDQGLGAAARQARAALVPLADDDMMANRLSQAGRARSVLEALRSRSVALRAIASLSKLTARSMGSDRFDDYTENLSRRSADLGATSERVRQILGSVTDHISSAGAAARDAVAALDVLLDAVAEPQDTPPPAKPRSAAEPGLAAAAGALRDRLRADVNGLVALMQFSDAYSQRMEHIETIAARPELSAVAGAQLEALAEDTREAVNETQDRFGRLSALVAEAAGHFREGGMAAQALREATMQHSALDTAVRNAASVSRAAHVVRDGAEVLQNSMNVAREALSALQDQSEDIGLSAINSLLLARGDERTSRAMSNLAASVGEHARHTSADLAECKRLMERLTEGSDTMAQTIVAHAETLDSLLAAARRDLEAEDARAETRHTGESLALRSVGDLEHALRDASAALDALRPLPERLEARAESLRDTPGALDVDAADTVRPIYTMQRERDVHDALLGRAPAAPIDTAAPEAQDLDDIFF